MTMTHRRYRSDVRVDVRCLLVLAVTLALGAVVANAAPRLKIISYDITRLQPVAGVPGALDVTARAVIWNLGDPASGVSARLLSNSPSLMVLDGDLRFGDVPRNRATVSEDTFTLRVLLPPRHNPLQILKFVSSLFNALAWQISCGNCGGNRPPVADAGADQTAAVGDLITLDGSESADADGQPLTYTWSFVSRPAGSMAALSAAASVTPTFRPDRDGDYIVQLVVNDGVADSAPDTVQISTRNSPPVARAGSDQSVVVGETVTLDGSASSDVDGDPLTYFWHIVARPAGSTADVVNPSQAIATLTPDAVGSYLVELTVSDGTASATDTMIVETIFANRRPMANAGVDTSARVGDTVRLDGSASSDPERAALSYRWSLSAQPAGSVAIVAASNTVSPTLTIDRAGTYVVQLIVSDGALESEPDTVVISTVNSPPVANPGTSRDVRWTTTVDLDGSQSFDPDLDSLVFTWSLLSRPGNSIAALSDPAAIAPTFVADRPGVYVVQLIVNDGSVNSAPVSISITATNQTPLAIDDSADTLSGAPVNVDVLANDSDGDGDTLTIASIGQPANGAATIQGSLVHYVPNAGFAGTEIFEYTATDGAQSATAVVRVNVRASNAAPVAIVGADQSVTTGEEAFLDGSGSFDPNGDALTYAWSLLAQPQGSTATLSTVTGAHSALIPDIAGNYLIQLTVSDGLLASTDSVTVSAVSPSLVLTVAGGAVSIGDVIIGMLTLPEVAPAQGQEVELTSTVPGRIQAPSRVFIAPGARQGSFAIDGLAVGETTVTALAIGIGSAHADVAVSERGFDFGAELVGVNVGHGAESSVVLRAPAPAGGAIIQIVSDDPAKLVVQPASLVIAPGEQVGRFTATGVAIGTVRITAAGASGVMGQASRFVGVHPAASDPTMTSADLIAAALDAGTISDEQALVYRVYAAFASPNLPAAFVGRVDAQLDTQLGVEINQRWSSLSLATQSAIVPFIMPPIYEGSWGDPNAGAVAFARSSVAAMNVWKLAAQATPNPNPCGTIGPNEPSVLLFWAKFVTPHFNFWYRTRDVPWNIVTAAQGAQAAATLAAVGEEVYEKLTGVMGREPDSDAAVPCNGGDGKLDVYIERNSPGLIAQVLAYPGGCDRSPSFMWVAGEYALNPKDARDIFAHEFLHMIQLAYAKGTTCTDYGWIDEATANWAIDYVYHDDNFEHRYFKAALTEPGQSNGSNRSDLTEISIPLDLGVLRRSYTTFCKGAGYCDYPFFLFLTKRIGVDVIRRTYEGSELFDPIASIEYGVRQGSLRDIWHDYSRTLYNDFTNGISDEFHDWDGIVHGIRWTTLNLGWDDKAEITVSLGGAPQRAFMNEVVEAMGNRDPRNPGHSPIYRLSTRVLSFKFTDPSVSYITMMNPSSIMSWPDLKLWAVQRINGEWRQPEDWTHRLFATFCRDVNDEHIDELVLIYSNGDSKTRGEQGQWFLDLDAANFRDERSLLPQLRVSNAGCFRWRGTTKVVETNPAGGVTEHTATVTFERYRDPLAPNGLPGKEFFRPVSGTATVQRSGPDSGGVCTESIPFSSLAIAATDTEMELFIDDYDNGGPTRLNRRAFGDGETNIPNVTYTLTCPFGPPIVATITAPSHWLALPLDGALLTSDGRTLSGTDTVTRADGYVLHSDWTLAAESEP